MRHIFRKYILFKYIIIVLNILIYQQVDCVGISHKLIVYVFREQENVFNKILSFYTIEDTPLPTFRRALEALRVEWRNSTQRFASKTVRRNKNIKHGKIGNRVSEH